MDRYVRGKRGLVREIPGQNQAACYRNAAHRQVRHSFGFELGARLGYG